MLKSVTADHADENRICYLKQPARQFLAAIKVMRTNVHSYDRVAFEIKHNAQIRFDFSGINRAGVASGKLVDLVGTQTRVERTNIFRAISCC